MAKTRQVIRVVNRSEVQGFEDQMWPINLALVILAGFVAGIILVQGGFDDPRLFYNAWVRLAALAFTLVGLLILAHKLDRRFGRRLQLAMLVSLIFHLGLAVFLTDKYIAYVQQQERERAQELVYEEERATPEYHIPNPDESQPQQEFEQPVEARAEQSQTDELTRQQTTPKELEAMRQPTTIPEPEPEKVPSPVELARQQMAAPRRADSPSKLSRRTSTAQSQPQQEITAPAQRPQQSRQAKAEVQAAATSVEQQRSRVAPQRRVTSAEPQMTDVRQQVQMANRAQQQPTVTDPTSTPTLRRKVAEATQTPRANTATEIASRPVQQRPSERPTPTQTVVDRRRAAGPQVTRQTVELNAATPSPTTPTETPRQQTAPSQPTLARVERPAPERRPVPAAVATATPTAPPSQTAEQSAARTSPAAQATSVARTNTQVASRRAATAVETPAQSTPTPTSSPARRANSAEAPQVTTRANQSAPSRRSTDSAVAAATTAAEAPASAATQSQQQSLTATGTQVTRSQTSGPVASRRTSATAPAGPASAAAVGAVRRQSSDTRPTLAQSAPQTPSRRAITTAINTSADTAPSSVTAQQPQTNSSPGPQATSLARSAVQSPSSTSGQRASAEAATAEASSTPSQAMARRSASSPSPSLTPSAAPSRIPRRAEQSSAVAASPAAVESPAVAQSARQDRPTARPSSSALSRAETGYTGRGRSQNVDVAMRATPQHSAPVAAAAAQRKQATQTEAGPALAPTAPAKIARSRAAAEAPSAMLTAQDVEVADVAGAQRPAQLTASSGAALERASSTAPSGNVSAAVGQVEVDTGAPQVVADVGTGRAGGGGQPEIVQNAQSQKISRARAGGAELAALAADTVQPTPTAPSSTGGGSPAGPKASLAAVEDAGERGAGASLPKLVQATTAGDDAPALPNKQVASAALSRAAGGGGPGGGQPELSTSPKPPTMSRTSASGALAAASAQDIAAPTAQSSTSGTTGQTSPQPAQLAGTAAARGGATVPATRRDADSAAAAGGGSLEVQTADVLRASAAEALPGVQAGGGTSRPARGKETAVAMLIPDAVPQLESTPKTGGAATGNPLDAQGVAADRQAAGLPGKAATGPVGAVAGEIPVDSPVAGSPGGGAVVAKAARGEAAAPTLGGANKSSGPMKKGATAALPSGMATDIAAPQVAMAAPATEGVDLDATGVSVGDGEPVRLEGTLPVRIRAEVGVGGLGLEISPDVGIPDRRAQSESEIPKREPGKFLKKKAGGTPVVSGTARDVAAPFARRGMRQRDPLSGASGKPSMKTEAAIEAGVGFLARHQSADGGWSFQYYEQAGPAFRNERADIKSDAAATGLALLAFLGAGYDHFDDKYKDRVAGGLEFLMTHQKADGDLYIPQDAESNKSAHLYSHGIATIALCEAYGMTGDPKLGDAAQKAIDFIVAAQHPKRGGWRYTPGYLSDLSVSGWQLMALKSGEMAGLEVPKATYDLVKSYIDLCVAPGGDNSKYVYNPNAPNTKLSRHGRRPSTTMTAVGLLMRLYTGWNREHPSMQAGADHLLANLPGNGPRARNENELKRQRLGTIRNPQRDTYYWYYATQVMFHMDGKYKQQWKDRLHPMLVESQIDRGVFAGSWDPNRPVPDTWSAAGGRIYLTAMNLLSLEVYWRLIPIYDEPLK